MTQNNTPAIEISTIISNLNEKFANIIANKEKYYAKTVPYIIEEIAKLGADNVFYMYKNYRGLYEDDYCTFYYWDNINGKVITDYWTTAAACPDFRLYTENVLTVEEAMNYGLLNMELVAEYNLQKTYQRIEVGIDKMEAIKVLANYNPIIQVNRGRKWRGTGYFITEIERCNNPYYPATIEAKVLSLDDFQIHYCNPNFLEYVELDSMMSEYKEWAKSVVDDVVRNKNYSSLFGTKGVEWTIKREDFSFEGFVKKNSYDISYWVANAYDEVEEKRKKELAEKKANEYINILEWVKTKTDKTTESEIRRLALNVLGKKF